MAQEDIKTIRVSATRIITTTTVSYAVTNHVAPSTVKQDSTICRENIVKTVHGRIYYKLLDKNIFFPDKKMKSKLLCPQFRVQTLING